MDKFLAEKADEEAFHPEARVFNYMSPEYGKPGSEKYKIGQLMAVQLNQQHMWVAIKHYLRNVNDK